MINQHVIVNGVGVELVQDLNVKLVAKMMAVLVVDFYFFKNVLAHVNTQEEDKKQIV
jgi:hypothetical protein